MRRSLQVLLFAGVIGVAAQLLFYRERVGLNLAVAIGLVLVLAWTVRRAPLRTVDAWLPAFAIAFAAFAAVRTDHALVAFDVLAALGLALATAVALRGTTVSTQRLTALLREGWSAAAAMLFGAAEPLRTEGPQAREIAGTRTRGAAAYAAGVAVAVPFVLTFGFLFMSADAVFEDWAQETLDADEWIDRLEHLRDRSALALTAAWLAAGALAHVALVPRSTASVARSWPRLPIETATVLVITIDLLFAAFVSFQITYLFGGRDTLAPAAVPYAEYARRGFFELVAVAALVALVLFTLELALGRRTRLYVAAGLGLIALTGVILVSSFYRLDLYQRAYGWSELRVYVVAGIAFLACALVVLAWALATRRMHHAMQPIVFSALAVALAVNAAGPSGLIARANIDRAIELAATPETTTPDLTQRVERSLDRVYLLQLGDGALPQVIAGLERLPEPDRTCVRILLLWQVGARSSETSTSWQGWNLDRARAEEAFLSIREDLYSLVTYPRDDYASRPWERLEQRYGNDCTYGRWWRPEF